MLINIILNNHSAQAYYQDVPILKRYLTTTIPRVSKCSVFTYPYFVIYVIHTLRLHRLIVEDEGDVSLEESVAMFLFIVGHNTRQRLLGIVSNIHWKRSIVDFI
jgi:hypothetical protein